MKNVLDVLKERGYVKQVVFEEELYELLSKESITFYTGYDPTADSLHVGHFVTLMAMAHLQRAGHRPIVLIGGGTAMVGDPSGRTDMRSMMTKETIQHNVDCFKKQMSRFIDFSEGKAIIANNADWLYNLNYIDFLREIGTCFSVNQMLTAECFKQRLERGLSFLEFNYMLMQGYDFLELNNRYNCVLQPFTTMWSSFTTTTPSPSSVRPVRRWRRSAAASRPPAGPWPCCGSSAAAWSRSGGSWSRWTSCSPTPSGAWSGRTRTWFPGWPDLSGSTCWLSRPGSWRD